MADSLGENADEDGTLNDTMIDDDDKTVNTATTATKAGYVAQEMTEHTIRYEIPYKKGQANKDDFKQHVKLMITISKVFDETELRITDNKNQRVKNFEEPKWLDAAYFQSHFTVHIDEKQRRTVIAHRIRSKKSIPNIKGESTVIAFLKSSNTFLRAHFWKEDEVILKDLGFLNRYVPTHHSKGFVLQDMKERIDYAEDETWAASNPKAPPFKLIHSQPRHKYKNKTMKTHAYSIQVLEKDATSMKQHLRKLYADEPLYIPYSMKKNNPEIVAQAIIKQNKKIADTFVIVVVGINRQAMDSLENTLKEVRGYIEHSDTNRTDHNGRWNILVDVQHFKSAKKQISTNLKHWIRSLSSIIREDIPTHFPIPQVNQKYGDDEDDSSAGHASYMSLCAQSYGSYDEADELNEQYFTPSNESNSKSYAAVVQSKKPPKQTVNEDQSQESRRMIASLQAEVASLKLERGNQTPSTVTAATTPDNDTNERLQKVETSMKEINSWMAEMCALMRKTKHDTTESNDRIENDVQRDSGNKHATVENSPTKHQSKRANTRTTPTRNMHPQQLFVENDPGGGNYGGYGGGYNQGNYVLPPPTQQGYNGYPYHMGQHPQSIQQYQHHPNHNISLLTQPMHPQDNIDSNQSLLAEGAKNKHE